MHALQGVLQSHRGYSGEAGEQRQGLVGVLERAERHREREKGREQDDLAPSMMRNTGIPRRRNAPPARRASAITAMNSGKARTLLRMPWLPSTSAAPRVTKLPVT